MTLSNTRSQHEVPAFRPGIWGKASLKNAHTCPNDGDLWQRKIPGAVTVRRFAVVLSFIFCFAFTATNSMAENDLSPLFASAAAELNVPLPILRAIARVESNGHPFAMNIAGKSLFLSGKAEAVSEAGKALAAGKSFDSGIMQINSQWLSRFAIPVDAVFDAEANIWLGSWILKNEIERHGQTWSAVARYHSPNPERGNRYVQKVKAVLAKESQMKPFLAPSLVPTASDSGQVASASGFIQRRSKVFVRESEPAAQIKDSTGHFVRRYHDSAKQ
ncbi:lytic transglycosylase domain-containing protein [Desulfosarcina sp. OttesenSCG-928-A07]|nr:lytic transglycosylase domain-containing protein [Desulfosarcina sp. OttesenSCG-928-G17]MDL2328479.1 lytic transglycosylase domain-containing protein [Desulfosarcina sp. OttesenSCG-928-A07]